MPRSELITAYRDLLDEHGLSVAQWSEDHWIGYLSVAQNVKRTQIANLPEPDQQKIYVTAAELARNGGVWNTRFQKLVPSILAAAHDCLEAVNVSTGRTLKVPKSEDLFFGEFPTSDFNARAGKVGEGYLILVNSGLADLLSQSCELLSVARRFSSEVDTPAEALIHCAKNATAIARKYNNNWSYVVLQNASWQFNETAADLMINDWTLEAMLAFVIAHEVSHVLLGHCEGKGNGLTLGNPGVHAIPSHAWRLELSADTLGVLVLERWCAHAIQRSKLPEEAAGIVQQIGRGTQLHGASLKVPQEGGDTSMTGEAHGLLHRDILPPSLGHKSRSQRMRPEIPLQSRELRAPLHNMADRLSG
jgi:hypothetical protein